MSALVEIRNRQRLARINRPAAVKFVDRLLGEALDLADFELGIHFVTPAEMACVNWEFLKHEGPTDVITFNHQPDPDGSLHGELFICPAVAQTQAKEFKTKLADELGRYVIHGVLHLLGYDDLTPADRRVMKRHENTLVRAFARPIRAAFK